MRLRSLATRDTRTARGPPCSLTVLSSHAVKSSVAPHDWWHQARVSTGSAGCCTVHVHTLTRLSIPASCIPTHTSPRRALQCNNHDLQRPQTAAGACVFHPRPAAARVRMQAAIGPRAECDRLRVA